VAACVFRTSLEPVPAVGADQHPAATRARLAAPREVLPYWRLQERGRDGRRSPSDRHLPRAGLRATAQHAQQQRVGGGYLEIPLARATAAVARQGDLEDCEALQVFQGEAQARYGQRC